jgi:putative transposase
LLLRSAAAALQKLALDPRYLGGRLGALAVLHTWTRAMLYHPHVHMLVSGGGLSADGKEWLATKHSAFLMPEGALSMIFRAKFCAALKKAGLLAQVPRQVWKKDWVVNCKAAGQGREVLNYLARYIFRVALSNSRLERWENGQVTFRYRDNHSQQLHRVTLPAQKFIHRFLLHVLPRGCAKVRYYGLWSPSCRAQLEQARTLLSAPTTTTAALDSAPHSLLTEPAEPAPATALCPHCHLGQLFELRVLLPQRKLPP